MPTQYISNAYSGEYIYPAVNFSLSEPSSFTLNHPNNCAHGAVKPIDQAGPTRPAAVTRENTYENTGETSSSVRWSRYKSQPRDGGGGCVCVCVWVSLENLEHEGNDYPAAEIASMFLMMMMMMMMVVVTFVSLVKKDRFLVSRRGSKVRWGNRFLYDLITIKFYSWKGWDD